MAVNQMNGTEKKETPVNVLQDENASLLALVRDRDATIKILHTTLQHQSAALASMSAQVMPVSAPGVNTDALEATIARLEKELETVHAAHEKKVADLEQSLEHTTQELKNKNLKLDQMEMEVDQAKACKQADHEDTKRQLEAAQNKIVVEKARHTLGLLRLDKELEDTKKKLGNSNLELLQMEVDQAKAANASEEAREALDEEVKSLRAQLKDTKTGLETMQIAHEKKVAQLTMDNRASEEAREALDEEVENLRAKHEKAIADLKKQPELPSQSMEKEAAAQAPGDAEADRKKVVVKVTPPLEKSDVDQINQILAGVQDGKTFAEKYMVTADFSRLTYAIITQKEGGDTENLQKATESLMKLLNRGNYTCTPSSLMSAKPKNLANMMQNTGMDPQQWQRQLQRDIDKKQTEKILKQNEKTQEHLDKVHLEEYCKKAKWHYHTAPDGVESNVDAESIIGECDFDSSIEVDEHLAGPFAGTKGRNLVEEIAWPNNVYCHLLDGHTKGRKKRLLMYGTGINRNAARTAAEALLKRVTAAAAAADTHASNTVGDHAAHALGQQ